jgi:hypothetical protein
MDPARCLGKAQLLGDRDVVLQLAKLHAIHYLISR